MSKPVRELHLPGSLVSPSLKICDFCDHPKVKARGVELGSKWKCGDCFVSDTTSRRQIEANTNSKRERAEREKTRKANLRGM